MNLPPREKAAPSTQRAAVHLKATTRAPGESREFVQRCLRVWNSSCDCDQAMAVVCELVTNAVTHASSDVELVVQRTAKGVVIEVSDGDSSMPQMMKPGRFDECHRGMIIVAAQSDRWGARATASGKTVWAEIDDVAV